MAFWAWVSTAPSQTLHRYSASTGQILGAAANEQRGGPPSPLHLLPLFLCPSHSRSSPPKMPTTFWWLTLSLPCSARHPPATPLLLYTSTSDNHHRHHLTAIVASVLREVKEHINIVHLRYSYKAASQPAIVVHIFVPQTLKYVGRQAKPLQLTLDSSPFVRCVTDERWLRCFVRELFPACLHLTHVNRHTHPLPPPSPPHPSTSSKLSVPRS